MFSEAAVPLPFRRAGIQRRGALVSHFTARGAVVPQSTISAIENDRVSLGVERAKTLARALRCHPAVLVFPGWEVPLQQAA